MEENLKFHRALVLSDQKLIKIEFLKNNDNDNKDINNSNNNDDDNNSNTNNNNKIDNNNVNDNNNNNDINSKIIVKYIDVANENNDEIILNFIDIANRYYSAKIFEINKSEECDQYGCITSRVLGLYDFPITFMNAKYIINIFLKLLQCLLKDDNLYLQYCKRDENSIEIPTSKTNMQNLIKNILQVCMNENNYENDDDDNIFDIKFLFLSVLQYMGNLQHNNAKKLQSGKLQKTINIAGGIHNAHELFQNNSILQNNISETLQLTGDRIHSLFYTYKNFIYNENACRNDLDNIKICIDNNSNICLYQNTNISYKFMMQFISNIFRVLFIDILPKTSMINCLYSTLYQASVLNEMNILNYNSKVIQLPLRYIIYS